MPDTVGVSPALRLSLSVVITATATGCVEGANPKTQDAGASDGMMNEASKFEAGLEGCSADATDFIYLIDFSRKLLRYSPENNSFETVGDLDCDDELQPFSMTVARDGVAWILYAGDDDEDGTLDKGKMFKASTEDAKCESAGAPEEQASVRVFSMGYSTDGEDKRESIHIAGAATFPADRVEIGTLDSEQKLTLVGDTDEWPELTGSGAGELWAFFPTTTPPSLRLMDKNDGTTSTVHTLPSFGDETPWAWAFALWDGEFFIFVRPFETDSTDVWRYDPESKKVEVLLEDTGYTILGAGVSTCSPFKVL